MSDGWSSSSVFISYRRQESSGLAGRLFDRLAARFGEDRVFMDIDRIELGVDFAEVIAQEVSTCAVLLAVIGPHWLDAADAAGRRRLEDPDDIVRLEIQAALDRDIRVIPILVDGATMPRPQQLRRAWPTWSAAMRSQWDTRASAPTSTGSSLRSTGSWCHPGRTRSQPRSNSPNCRQWTAKALGRCDRRQARRNPRSKSPINPRGRSRYSGSTTMGLPSPTAPCNHRSVRRSSRT
jgi:hypothetical protein